MNRAAHLVKFDVRRFRVLLAAWILALIADAIVRVTRPSLAVDDRLMLPFELLVTVLFALRWLGTIAIVPLVVQAHPLVGSDAFWMTRPIPWRTLLTSKVVVLGTALVAVPAACEVGLMLAFRVPLAEIVPVALHTTLLQALLLVGVMTVSVMTPNLPRYALALGGVLVGTALLLNVLLVVAIRTLPDGPQLSIVEPRSDSPVAPLYATLVLLCGAALTLIIVQYRTRSRPRALLAGLTALAVPVLAGIFWPHRLQPVPAPEWATSASALQLIGTATQGEFRTYEQPMQFGQASGWRLGAVHARVRGVEPDWLASVRLADGSIELEDGRRLTTTGNGFQSSVPFDAVDSLPLNVVLRHVLAVNRVVGQVSEGAAADEIPGIVISEEAFREQSGRTGTFRGRYVVDLEHLRIASVLPLQPGATFQDRGFRLVIERVVQQQGTVSIGAREVTTRTLFDDGLSRRSFYLRNRDRSEAIAGAIRPASWGMSLGGVPFFFASGVSHLESTGVGFNVTSGFLQFPEPYARGRQAIAVDAAWLAGAELVIVRTDPSGSVVRTLEIPGLRIAEGSPTPDVRDWSVNR